MKKFNLRVNLLSIEEIEEIYEKYVVKSDEYYRKSNDEYHKLSDAEKREWFPRDFPRLASLFDYKEWVEKYDLHHVGKLLSTCETDFELKSITYDQIFICDYLVDKKYELHTMDLEDKDYDMIIFNQTLEHLYNPFIVLMVMGLGYFILHHSSQFDYY